MKPGHKQLFKVDNLLEHSRQSSSVVIKSSMQVPQEQTSYHLRQSNAPPFEYYQMNQSTELKILDKQGQRGSVDLVEQVINHYGSAVQRSNNSSGISPEAVNDSQPMFTSHTKRKESNSWHEVMESYNSEDQVNHNHSSSVKRNSLILVQDSLEGSKPVVKEEPDLFQNSFDIGEAEMKDQSAGPSQLSNSLSFPKNDNHQVMIGHRMFKLDNYGRKTTFEEKMQSQLTEQQQMMSTREATGVVKITQPGSQQFDLFNRSDSYASNFEKPQKEEAYKQKARLASLEEVSYEKSGLADSSRDVSKISSTHPQALPKPECAQVSRISEPSEDSFESESSDDSEVMNFVNDDVDEAKQIGPLKTSIKNINIQQERTSFKKSTIPSCKATMIVRDTDSLVTDPSMRSEDSPKRNTEEEFMFSRSHSSMSEDKFEAQLISLGSESEHEISAVFGQSIKDSEIEAIQRKQTELKTLMNHKPPIYNDLYECYKIFEKGVEVLKVNFTDGKIKKVLLQITPIDHQFYYTDLEPSKNYFRKLFGPQKIHPSTIKGVLYGGKSISFVRHKIPMLNRIKHQRVDECLLKDSQFGRMKSMKFGSRVQREWANNIPFKTETNKRLETLEAKYPEDKVFYAWECVSLVFKLHTLDFVIKDNTALMAFLHIAHYSVHRPKTPDFLRVYKVEKLKIKLSYEAWINRCSVQAHFRNAITKTLEQLQLLEVKNIRDEMAEAERKLEDKPINVKNTFLENSKKELKQFLTARTMINLPEYEDELDKKFAVANDIKINSESFKRFVALKNMIDENNWALEDFVENEVQVIVKETSVKSLRILLPEAYHWYLDRKQEDKKKLNTSIKIIIDKMSSEGGKDDFNTFILVDGIGAQSTRSKMMERIRCSGLQAYKTTKMIKKQLTFVKKSVTCPAKLKLIDQKMKEVNKAISAIEVRTIQSADTIAEMPPKQCLKRLNNIEYNKKLAQQALEEVEDVKFVQKFKKEWRRKQLSIMIAEARSMGIQKEETKPVVDIKRSVLHKSRRSIKRSTNKFTKMITSLQIALKD